MNLKNGVFSPFSAHPDKRSSQFVTGRGISYEDVNNINLRLAMNECHRSGRWEIFILRKYKKRWRLHLRLPVGLKVYKEAIIKFLGWKVKIHINVKFSPGKRTFPISNYCLWLKRLDLIDSPDFSSKPFVRLLQISMKIWDALPGKKDQVIVSEGFLLK